MEMISPEEKQKITEQLEELKSRRPEISQRIAEARELGDLKENADYHAAREDQGVNEARIRQLEERLSKAMVTGQDSVVPEDMVFLGATVKLRNVDNEEEMLYRLVGESSGVFSDEVIEVTSTSPMGSSLMRARIGEVIRVDLPRGTKRFEVIEIVA
ncbi:MAG: transcription elongation factor GreA [Phycisphaerales bacterium]|nr:transcription elongation factor GreA [Phycisphaerales bacterium]